MKTGPVSVLTGFFVIFYGKKGTDKTCFFDIMVKIKYNTLIDDIEIRIILTIRERYKEKLYGKTYKEKGK